MLPPISKFIELISALDYGFEAEELAGFNSVEELIAWLKDKHFHWVGKLLMNKGISAYYDYINTIYHYIGKLGANPYRGLPEEEANWKEENQARYESYIEGLTPTDFMSILLMPDLEGCDEW